VKITLYRLIYDKDRTLGILEVNGSHFATLEPPRKKEGKPRAIPLGSYQAETFISKKAKGKTFKLKKVPDFSDVLIHIGNYPWDTSGCILIGMEFATDGNGSFAIYRSGEAMKLFQKVTDKEDEITLEIRELL